MYVLGAHIITTYSGKPYHEYVQERIIKPLDMSSTVQYAQDVAPGDHIAHAFTAGSRRTPLLFESEHMATLLGGAGGIISNTVDMVSSNFIRNGYPSDLPSTIDQVACDAHQRWCKSSYK